MLEDYLTRIKTGQDMIDAGIVPKTSSAHLALLTLKRLKALVDHNNALIDDDTLGKWMPAIDVTYADCEPEISWNTAVRNYHNTRRFIARFEAAEEPEKKQMLNDVISNVTFMHQQNNDVNLWLYQNYRQLCVNDGIEFEVIQPSPS